MSSITPTRTLSINACVPPSTRGTTKTNRESLVSPASFVSPASLDSSPEPTPEPSPPDSPVIRQSFSAFDEIHLETPQELKPFGVGLTRTATSETFRENFNRFNNIPPGGGLGNLGNLSRSNSSSSTSSKASTRSEASSVGSASFPEKPPVYTPPKVEEQPVEKKGSVWSPLSWLKWVCFSTDFFHFFHTSTFMTNMNIHSFVYLASQLSHSPGSSPSSTLPSCHACLTHGASPLTSGSSKACCRIALSQGKRE